MTYYSNQRPGNVALVNTGDIPMTEQTIASPIICSRVEVAQRMDILPRYAGERMMILERLIFDSMRQYCVEYTGGYWEMWELSNGGFYMAPSGEPKTYAIAGPYNYYSGVMSADAAGIVACLIAFNRLACSTVEDRFINLFHNLRAWAKEHPEADEILSAID